MAPATLDLDTINLSGLADQSVSAEVIQPGDVLEVAMVTDYTKLTTTTTPVRVADDGTIIVPLVGRVERGRAGSGTGRTGDQRREHRPRRVPHSLHHADDEAMPHAEGHGRRGGQQAGHARASARIDFADGGAVGRRRAEQRGRHGSGNPAHRFAADRASGRATAHAAVAGRPQCARFASGLRAISPAATEPAIVKVDLTAATAGAMPVPNLRDGDVVNVAKRKLPPIYVIGLVTKPGEFPYPPSQEIRVTDALALAGGVSNAFAEDVLVIRHLPERAGAGPHRGQHPRREKRPGQHRLGARRHHFGGTNARHGLPGRDPNVRPLRASEAPCRVF